MYHELGEFLWQIGHRKALWADGELWTALVLSGLAGWLFHCDPAAISAVRERFGELLAVSSIVFGFVLTAMMFYIQASSDWSRNPSVNRVAKKLVDWHVWTVMCLLVLIGLIIFMWLAEDIFTTGAVRPAVSHAALVFLALYCSFQILNHVLTVRWVARRRFALRDGPPNTEPRTEPSRSNKRLNE